MVSFELGKEIEKYVFRLVTNVKERKNSESPWGIEPQTFGFRAHMLYHWATETKVSAESEGLRFDSSWELGSYSFSLARDKKKNIFLYFFTELKTYQISYSIYKHYANDVANPSKCIQCILRTRTVRERDWLSRERPETSIEFHDWEGEAIAYTSLSAAYHILYQNEKAIEYCGKGLKIFRGKGIRQGEGRSCINLLSYYLHLGDHATALKCSEEASKQFVQIRSRRYPYSVKLRFAIYLCSMKGLSGAAR